MDAVASLNPFDNTLTVAGRHTPDCDSQLGPEFEVGEGVVTMTLHACFGCLPIFPESGS